jgi:hypothetical protein
MAFMHSHEKMAFSLIVAATAVATAIAAVPADEVTSLPGYNGSLPSKHYSGYLDVGKLSGSKGKLHYVG